MKRPSFQFYPADWRKDPALSSCSLAARGLWITMLCVAHESDVYGHLVVNDVPMTTAQIARVVGEEARVVARLLVELEAAGVFSRDERGSIYSRRMVADERLRNVRADCGRLGGNPNLLNQKDNQKPTKEVKQPDNQSLTPSSSSSSSSSKEPKPLSSTSSTVRHEKTKNADPPPAGFLAFWQAYPATHRRVAKQACLAKWQRTGCESNAETIVAHVRAMTATQQWQEGYEPAPLTYLNQRRWEDGLPSAPQPERQERRLALG